MVDFTPLQKKFIRTPIKRINILQGSVSSGKTYVSLIVWGMRVRCSPLDTVFLMAGKTQTTLKRNCLDLLQKIFGEKNFHYSMATKTAILFNHQVYLEGADNERAEDKIRGLTLDGAYLDEATLMPESFFTMLLSRLRKKGAFLYATTNPDNPMHWLKRNYIDKADELNCAVWNFKIDDNTFLPADYVKNIKKEYTGVFYKRFIDGDWVIADGLVFSAFNEEKHIIKTSDSKMFNKDYAEKYIGIDYGILNPTAFTLWGWHIKNKEWHCLKEYYYSGRDSQRNKTDSELYQDLVDWASGINGIMGIVVDPSASSFIAQIQRAKEFRVFKANNEVNAGIAYVNVCFSQDKVRICDNCKNLRNELYSYVWDTDKSQQQGKDVVIKANDHACDSMRYFFYTIVKPKSRLYGIGYREDMQ